MPLIELVVIVICQYTVCWASEHIIDIDVADFLIIKLHPIQNHVQCDEMKLVPAGEIVQIYIYKLTI